MQFTNELYQFLQKQGFGFLERENLNVWGKQQENILYLLQIIPERLPGQKMVDFSTLGQEQQEIGRQWMLRTGCQVEWFTWMIFRGEPSLKERSEIERYENLWAISYEISRIYIYENQKGNYCNLREPFEDFLYSYKEKADKEKKNELRTVFTPVNTMLLGMNILVFLVLSSLGNTEDANFMAEHGAMSADSILSQGKWYLLVTAMFIHFGAEHLLQNMIVLLVTGSRLERVAGKWKYLFLYIVSGLTASLSSLCFTLIGNEHMVSGGASGAVFGVMGALLGLIIKDLVTRRRKRIQNIGIPGIVFMVGAALFYGFVETGIDNAAHLGGVIAGFILSMIML